MHWSQDFDRVMNKLGWPDLGDRQVWRWWFARCQSMLEQHGWFDLLQSDNAIADGEVCYPERTTIFALRWITEDFCSVIDSYDYEPDWSDWFDALGIRPRVQLPAAHAHNAWPEVISIAKDELGLPDDPADYDDDEDTRIILEEELDAILITQSMLLVIAEKRRSIVRILVRVWGGHHRLYQSLFAALHSESDRGDDCHGDYYGEDENEVEEADSEDLEAFESILKKWQGMAVNRLAEEALDGPGTLAELGEKQAGYEWICEDCPIRVQGSPQFYGVGDFM